MARESRTRGNLRTRIGICINEDCELAKAKEKQSVRSGHDFVCEKCGSELREVHVKTTNPNWKLIGGIIAAVLVLGGVGVAVLLMKDSPKPQKELQTVLSTDSVQQSATVSNTPIKTENTVADSLIAKSEEGIDTLLKKGGVALDEQIDSAKEQVPNTAADSLMAKSEESIDTSLNKGGVASDEQIESTEGRVSESLAEEKETVTQTKSTPQAANGKLKLSYGAYIGDLKNGYPHGQGRLTYTTERQINRYDMKKRTAKPGQYVIGEFERGFFIQGRLYAANGDLLGSIMIGTAPGNAYDSK